MFIQESVFRHGTVHVKVSAAMQNVRLFVEWLGNISAAVECGVSIFSGLLLVGTYINIHQTWSLPKGSLCHQIEIPKIIYTYIKEPHFLT